MPAKKVLSTSTPAKKPSLASLKPDKELNKRARTKAVKKIESHVSKKSASKKSPIVARRKSETTGLSIKRVTKKKTIPQPEPVLILPKNMSIRAREKALVLLEQVSKDFQKSAQQVAYVSGLCFMFLGASMALAFSGTLSSDSQSALLASSTISGTVTTTSQLPQNRVIPEISLLDALPAEATTVTEHKLAVLHAKEIFLRVRSLQTGSVETLSVDDLSLELYKFKIEPDNLVAGRHSVVAYAVSAIDGSKHSFNLGEFLVPSKQVAPTSATTTPPAPVVEPPEVEEIEEEEEVITPSNAATTTTATTTPAKLPVIGITNLKVITTASEISGRTLIKVEAPKDLEFVELYVRQPKSSNSRFIGLAERRTDNWYFFFNTVNVPNGDYEILARARVSGKDFFSAGVKARISNFAPVINETPETESEPVEEEEIETEPQEAPEAVQSGRSLPGFTVTDVDETESQDITLQAPLEIKEVLATYADEIKKLFDRYAVAQQSGDPMLIDIARKQLIAGREEILNEILTDDSINYLADEAKTVLAERFAILEKRVDTFEELRRTASDSQSSIDTDKDGVSDFDEKKLYNTDPMMPDTDNDGVQDGVEIMRGFDPLNPDTEAIISFELPQESLALVQDDVLKVDAVLPLVKNDDETGKSVQAEISGKALPNSYVTLYIFSSPTIVTVRTDENGVFNYTFEKELEDGSHEVYVAVTDNTGAIVAKSNPFRFVKQAEAFSPINGPDGQASNGDSVISIAPINSFNTVVGLGILAFGLILLMLGISMREKASGALQETPHDLKTS